MKQPAKTIPCFSIVEYKGKQWYIQKQIARTTCLVSKDEYKEIDNDTLLTGIASVEQIAKHFIHK
jgi:hypothetical protein